MFIKYLDHLKLKKNFPDKVFRVGHVDFKQEFGKNF
jgi:hypothetical protein